MLAILLDQTIVAAALPTIVGDLGGLSLTAGSCWLLARLAKAGPVPGAGLAREAGVTLEHGRPYVDKLVDARYVRRDDGLLELTLAVRAAAGRLFAAGRDGLERLVSDWSPQQHLDRRPLSRV
jgi:hypothetical protein